MGRIRGGVGMLLAQSVCMAQSAETLSLRQEIGKLKTQVQSMQTELDQIKTLLREQKDRANPSFDIAGYPAEGNPQAKLVLIEFSDFECPFCSEYIKTSYRQVVDGYVKSGKVLYVFVDFPGEKIHPHAVKAAEAGRCANEQGKFWEMHDQLFAHQRELGTTGIADAAKAAGLRAAEFETCAASGKYSAAVRGAEEATSKLGLQGTPAFVFGTFEATGSTKVRLVRALIGNQSYPVFQQAIDALLPRQN